MQYIPVCLPEQNDIKKFQLLLIIRPLKYIITYYQAYQDLGKADKFFTRPQWFDLLIGNRTVREQIMKGASEEEIRAGWQNELEAYKKMREKYLLYE